MKIFNCKIFIFSSSASIYGESKSSPIKENFPLNTTNPYGRTKLIIENFFKDVYSSDNSWMFALLRYFNPIGAHKSGLIGENPLDTPNNLMPYLLQVAAGKRDKLRVFGNDYDTYDGTGVRDYIHVTDLAQAHVKALQALEEKHHFIEVNLGTGKGYSVLDIIRTFEEVSGISIPYEVVARRDGDIASCYADPRLAKKLLKWTAKHTLNEMCIDSLRWQTTNPNGYNDKNKLV